MSEHWCWKNSLDLCCILKIGQKKFFFHQNFSTNQISRKNETQLFDFFLNGIESSVNIDAEKILFAFVVFTKSKFFFKTKIFRPIRIREKFKFNSSTFSPLESTNEWTVMLKKSYWALLYSRNPWEKIFFHEKFFDQSEFEKKSISIIGPIAHSNRERSRYWRCKNSIVLCCIFQIGRRKIFFNLNFSTNQNSRKNQIELWDLLLIRIDGGANTDPVNVVFTFVLSSKSRTKRFFCIKIFRPIRIREKIKLNYGTCCSLGSTEEPTLILSTLFSILFYRPDPWQSDFFV